jgi:hypothetical protein
VAPEDIASRLNSLIDESDIMNGSFSIESSIMLASALVKNPRLRTALAWSGLGLSVGSRIWEKVVEHRKAQQKVYTIKVEVDDDVFDLVSAWITRDVPEHEQYVIEARRAYGRPTFVTDDDEPLPVSPGLAGLDRLLEQIEEDIAENTIRRPKPVNAGYKNLVIDSDTEQALFLNVDGHELSVQFIVPGSEVAGQDGDQREKYRGEPHYLITCPSLEARRAFLKKVDESFVTTEKRKPRVYRSNSWGDMDNVGDVPARQLDTVILKQGQIEELIGNLKRFLDTESYYTELGIPYHHGVLLYGPPGTGKTSIAAAVANHLDLDVYAIQLSGVRDDSSLNSLMRSARPRSVLLLEDIDTLKAAREDGGDSDSGVTIDGLLQSLDGFAAPHGLITVMTTNKVEQLDFRLIRAGRVDLKMEISNVDTEQVQRLCQRFIGYVPDDLPELVPSDGVSPAEVIGVFKTFMYDRAGAGPALVKRLRELAEK